MFRLMAITLMLGASMSAAAKDDRISEEVLVFGDPFAQWDETRWFVELEQAIPRGVLLRSDTNSAFYSHAIQTRAVIACSKEYKLGKGAYEVDCVFEDVGLIATGKHQRVRPEYVERMNGVLAEIDAKLTGARLQLQVGDRGTVRNVDIEGLPEDNRDQARLNEGLRQMLSGMVAGFHLKLDKEHLAAKQWVERDSRLMGLPSSRATGGSSRLEHTVTKHDGNYLVQSVGRGTISVPYTPWEGFSSSANDGPTALGGSGGGSKGISGPSARGATSESAPEIGDPKQEVNESEVQDVLYSAQFSGVAVYEPKEGVMIERVWMMNASPNGVQTVAVWHAGRLRILGEDEKADVGPSELVAAPGQSTENRPAWVAMNQ